MSKLIQEALQYLVEVKEETLKKKSAQLFGAYYDNPARTSEITGSEILDKLHAWDKLGTKNLLKPEDKQLDQIKSVEQLDNILANYAGMKTKSEVKKENLKDAKIIFDNDKVTIYTPLTKEASCLLGKGTKWCTAAKKDNKFNHYTEQEIVLYYVLPKDGTGKYAVAVGPEGTKESFDAQDKSIDVYSVYNKLIGYGVTKPAQYFLPIQDDARLEKILANSTKNPDGTLDTEQDIQLSNMQFTELPFNFNSAGSFRLSSCPNLVSLKGCPKELVSPRPVFRISLLPKITSLEGMPEKLVGSYGQVIIESCPIPVIEHLPKKLFHLGLYDMRELTRFNCRETILNELKIDYCNHVKSLEGLPKEVIDSVDLVGLLVTNLTGIPVAKYYSLTNMHDLTSLEGLPKKATSIWLSACESLESLTGMPDELEDELQTQLIIKKCHKIKSFEGCPTRIPGAFTVSMCDNLKDLTGFPKEIGGDFSWLGGPFTEEEILATGVNITGDIRI